ncbi:hypothetical protein DPEC_G00324520 [Dallia pectoralis]|uniref:Uncharacterized protein n=1 Tax=Dallia pectoralis TaxID=75939 RepID=A0ACC2FB13_DALPE|nr:hypothetical protein DPEC_G00324520 [Dallia pectoralis]
MTKMTCDQDHNSSIQHLSSTQGCQKSSEINIYPSATESQMDQSSSRDITPEMKNLQDWYRRLEDLENEVQRILMENVSNDQPTINQSTHQLIQKPSA